MVVVVVAEEKWKGVDRRNEEVEERDRPRSREKEKRRRKKGTEREGEREGGTRNEPINQIGSYHDTNQDKKER